LDGGGNTASKINFIANEETPHCGGSSLGAKTSSDVGSFAAFRREEIFGKKEARLNAAGNCCGAINERWLSQRVCPRTAIKFF
jgi:hypothetical protein